MEIRTLHQVEISELTDVFNRAFDGYFEKFELTEVQMQRKLTIDQVDLQLSPGAFSNGKLVGFILHGIDRLGNLKTAYNTGTGVLPDYRGKKLTVKLFENILPRLKSAGIKRCLLEVIDQNRAAIRSYEKCGFRMIRELVCYKYANDLNSSLKSNLNFDNIQEINHPDWNFLASFRDWQPAWQNSERSIKFMEDKIITSGYFQNSKLQAYISFYPDGGRILQFAVKKEFRRLGIGTKLFRYAEHRSKNSVSMINIDGRDTATSSFLLAMGLVAYLIQHEMEMENN